MKLYLAYQRVPYEGGYLLGVFHTEKAAQTRVDDYKATLYGGRKLPSDVTIGVEPIESNEALSFYF